MAKIAFWITAGPDQVGKAMSGLRLAERLKTNRGEDVKVYLFGPGVALGQSDIPEVVKVLEDLRAGEVGVQACPANVEQLGLDQATIEAHGINLRPAGEVLVELVEAGYQIVGI